MPAQKLRPTQISREVIRLQRPALDVESSAFQHAADVADSAAGLFSEGLPAEATLPDLELLQIIIGNILRLRREALEEADEANFAALSRLNHLRLVRDDVKGRLLPKLTEIRDTFDAAFGVDTCQRILGVGIGIPEDPLTVRRLSDRVLNRLTAADFQLPPALSEGVKVEPEQWVLELKPNAESLSSTLVDLSEAKRQADLTLEAKEAQIESYTTVYGGCSRLLEALYEVAGREHLAERLRPTTRRSKSSVEAKDPKAGDDSEPEGDEDAPQDAPPSSQEPPAAEDPADPAADPPAAS